MKILSPRDSSVNIKYAYYLMQTVQISIDTHKRYWISEYSKLEIPLPSPTIQNEIVSKIEELFSELDKGIADLKTAQQQLKVYRQSVLKAAFEGKLTNDDVVEGELPKGWKNVILEEVCEIKRGKSKHRPRNASFLYGGKYPFIQTGDIRNANGGYIKEYSQTYSDQGLQQSKLWPKGTLCITIAANIGETAILGIDACFPDSVVGLLADEKFLLTKYTNYYFIFFKQKLDELAPATAQKNINVDILEKVNIPLAPLEEQYFIIQEIESCLSIADKIEESITQSLQQAEALRQSILKKAFEGKLAIHIEQTSEEETKIIPLFPAIKENIRGTDLHAAVIGKTILAHEGSQKHRHKLTHIKCEKIAHLVEYQLGISLGREPAKDAAGPDDYPHLKKVEHRANMANWFGIKKLSVGHTYQSKKGIQTCIEKAEAVLNKEELASIDQLIQTFLPFELEHAELIATIHAGWNNLLLSGKHPTDEEIVYESRENWSDRKLTIPRENFFKTLEWMKRNDFIPPGKGKVVSKKEEVVKAKPTKPSSTKKK